jgi:hypothetical protein
MRLAIDYLTIDSPHHRGKHVDFRRATISGHESENTVFYRLLTESLEMDFQAAQSCGVFLEQAIRVRNQTQYEADWQGNAFSIELTKDKILIACEATRETASSSSISEFIFALSMWREFLVTQLPAEYSFPNTASDWTSFYSSQVGSN